jgi:imidazolonepropionase-like amidohydrolase
LHRKFPILILLTLIFGCQRSVPPADLILRGGNVVDVVTGETTLDQDIWIFGERIDYIGPSGERRVPSGVEIVDVAGHYLIPGLVDAHVHLDHVDELPLYLIRGITTVFNLRGVPRHLEWRDAVARGDLLGPTIYTCGDYLSGNPPYMEPLLSLDSPEDAAAAVRAQHAAGYDMIKVYTRLSLEQLQAIGQAARKVGMPVVGHGGENYSLQEMIDAGQVNLAHGNDLVRWWGNEEQDRGVPAILEALRGKTLTITANLAWDQGLLRQAEDLEGLVVDPIAEALPAAILQPFRRANNRYVRRGTDWVPDVRDRLEANKMLMRQLHEAGVTLLAGSDASTAGVLPGNSLLNEVVLLAEAGLSPLDALRAATLAPGDFVAEQIDTRELFGRIAKEHRADILVLKSNPLERIANITDQAGVVSRGQWLDRDVLDAKLAELTAKSRRVTPQVIAIEDGIKSGDLLAARAAFDSLRAADPEEIAFAQYMPFFIGYSYLYGDEGYNSDPQRLSAALTLYEMYAQTYPDYHSAHYLLALAREANGDEEGAIAALKRALEIHPTYPNAREKLAALES